MSEPIATCPRRPTRAPARTSATAAARVEPPSSCVDITTPTSPPAAPTSAASDAGTLRVAALNRRTAAIRDIVSPVWRQHERPPQQRQRCLDRRRPTCAPGRPRSTAPPARRSPPARSRSARPLIGRCPTHERVVHHVRGREHPHARSRRRATLARSPSSTCPPCTPSRTRPDRPEPGSARGQPATARRPAAPSD